MAKLIVKEAYTSDQIAKTFGYKYLTDTHHEEGKNTKVYIHPDGHVMIHHLGTNKIHFINGKEGTHTDTTLDKMNSTTPNEVGPK